MAYEWVEAISIPEEEKKVIHNHFLNNWRGLSHLGNGSNCNVYAYNDQYAIKAYCEEAHNKRDFTILSAIHDYEYFPNLYYGVKGEEWEYVVVERLYGETLLDYDGNYPTNIVNTITWAFYSALEKGYLMNDIIFENIMVQPNGEIKLFDVGAFIRVSPNMRDYQKIVDNQYEIIIKMYQR